MGGQKQIILIRDSVSHTGTVRTELIISLLIIFDPYNRNLVLLGDGPDFTLVFFVVVDSVSIS